MRIIVCGGREFNDKEKVYSVLDDYLKLHPNLEIISGMARGADSIAAEWAGDRQVKLWRVFADWEQFKRAAGFIRNKRMLVEFAAQKVVAFPGGNGTEHMVTIARKAGIEVREYK